MIHEEIRNNKIKTVLLIFVFILFVSALGWLFGTVFAFGFLGVSIALILALIITVVQYYHGDRMVLRISKAKLAEKPKDAHLINTVEGLAIAAGIPKPKIYVIDDSAMNAFATGRDPEHASVAVTTGLMTRLNRQELEGVLAHELSHVKNYDIKIMTIAVALVGVVVMLSNFFLRSLWFGGGRRRSKEGGAMMIVLAIVLALIAPLFAMLIKMAVSRKREFLADASGAHLTRYPEGLASALEKISNDKEPLEVANKATAHLYFANPFKGKGFSNWFSTHPPIEERVARLRGM